MGSPSTAGSTPCSLDDQEFFLDLLFYHHRLRRFVVIDLKIGRFEPEYAGKMHFYLNAVDEQLRLGDDGQSIGLILCTSKNETIVKLALGGVGTPIAVSDYVGAEAQLIDEGALGPSPRTPRCRAACRSRGSHCATGR